jgi:hypothetical protein
VAVNTWAGPIKASASATGLLEFCLGVPSIQMESFLGRLIVKRVPVERLEGGGAKVQDTIGVALEVQPLLVNNAS